MSGSDDKAAADEAAHAEAQRAADGLKEQIAKVRARIRDAHKTLREQAQREQEPRSFRK